MTRLVILWREGVIYPAVEAAALAAADRQPVPGSLEAIARLNHWGYTVAVLTPLAGSADGPALDTLNAANARFNQLLSRVGGHVDGIFIYKEKAGARECGTELYQAIGDRFSHPLSGTPVIAGVAEVLAPARQLGANGMLISGNEPGESAPANRDYPCYDDLGHAVEHLLTRRQ